MKLYFVRHGESTANLLHEFSNSGFKHPLTEQGVAQAHAVADTLSGLAFKKIYTSPLLRAQQTAQLLSARLNAPLEISVALQEWSVGAYEGTTNPAGWELHRQVQEDWFVHRKFDSKIPGGESFNEIRTRFIPFIQRLIRSDNDFTKQILLVAHGGLYLAMLPVIFENVGIDFARQHGFSYTDYAVAETRINSLWCLSWCGRVLDDLRG